MSWDRFFFFLGRINAVLLFSTLCIIAILFVVDTVRYQTWDDHHAKPYGVPGLAGLTKYEGVEIALSDGTVVKYSADGSADFDAEVEAPNISLTHMKSGKSRLVLPANSEQVVLRFEHIGLHGEGTEPASAYMVLAGTPKNYADGKLDLILGRLSDLEQVVVARQLSFVDSVRMIDPNTVSMIVWPSNDEAQFWLFDLRTMTRTLSRNVEVPLPKNKVKTVRKADAEAALEAAGHWGVPTLVFDGEPFFGQDRIDMVRWRMEQKGLAAR